MWQYNISLPLLMQYFVVSIFCPTSRIRDFLPVIHCEMLVYPVLGRRKLHVVELHSLTTICWKLLVVKLHSYFVLRQVIQLILGHFFVV